MAILTGHHDENLDSKDLKIFLLRAGISYFFRSFCMAYYEKHEINLHAMPHVALNFSKNHSFWYNTAHFQIFM